MPRDERPYEKCSRLGAEHLSDVELLAVLLRTGTRGENALELQEEFFIMPAESAFSEFISLTLNV